MSNRSGYKITDQFATYFLTFTIVGWVDVFTRNECKEILINSLKYCQKEKGLVLNAYVIMSNHIHIIASAGKKSKGLSRVIGDFKKYTSKRIIDWVLNSKKESRKEWMEVVFKYHAKFNKNNQKYQVWQQNNRPKILMHPKFTNQKLRYIHNNPVVAEIVDIEENYLYSSSRNYLGYKNCKLEVDIIDFGVEEGYIFH